MKDNRIIALPLSEFRAFGDLLRMALTRDPDEFSIRSLITQYRALELTGKKIEHHYPETEPRIFSQGHGMERVIDVPVSDIEPT